MEEVRLRCDQLTDELVNITQLACQAGYRAGYDAGRPKIIEGKKLTIHYEDEEFGRVLCMAVRGALKEPGSALALTAYLKPILQNLSYKTLWSMERDIMANTIYLSAAELEIWKKFVIHVRTQLNHKRI